MLIHIVIFYTYLSCIYDILQFFSKDLMPAGLYHQVAQLRRTTSVLLDRKVNNENCLRSVLYYYSVICVTPKQSGMDSIKLIFCNNR